MEPKYCSQPGCGKRLPDHLFDRAGEKDLVIKCPACEQHSVFLDNGNSYPISDCYGKQLILMVEGKDDETGRQN
jgi:hypothetical protein